jgi:hypothetical protein
MVTYIKSVAAKQVKEYAYKDKNLSFKIRPILYRIQYEKHVTSFFCS